MTDQLDLETTYRTILNAARQRRFISYGDLAKANGAEWAQVRYKMNHHLGDLVKVAAERGWPMPSALVVNQSNIETGTLDGSAREGFISAARDCGFDVDDPAAFVEEQQQAMFGWAPDAPDDPDFAEPQEPTERKLPGPKFIRYLAPILDALRSLGGSAEPKQVVAKVQEIADVTEQELKATSKSGQSRYENKIGWARFYLAKAGLIDGKTRGRWLLTPKGRETYLDHQAAMELFKDVRKRFSDAPSDDEGEGPPPVAEEYSALFDDLDRRFWFVGALWGSGTDDQTDRFLEEGIWQNGYDERFSEHVARMKPGDKIAIKASFTKKYGLPFDNQEKPVSCMRIKAIGTITEATKDGKTVKVDWTELDEPKDWYFYTYRVTIVEADASEELARRLIQFAFGDHKQDYEFWLSVPYFAKKYRPRGATVTEVELEEEAEADNEEATFETYDVGNIVADGCFLTDGSLTDALARLSAKRNLILQGPPGTGKTWLAKRLAYALIGTKDRKITRKRMRTIQFHPSLSYEDFVRGWRPDGNGQLKLTDGVFLEAVEAARAERDRPFVVIIEEINRGNPAQIFGEMLTLLEKDKRREEEAIELAYHSESGDRVYIPDNLYVIGTMNIADRSLALVDLALRRRFAFITLETMLNERWKQWCIGQARLEDSAIDDIQRLMTELNEEIANDRNLGSQFKIGHSYVTPGAGEKISDARSWFRHIVKTEISPLLEEYWYDNPDKAVATGRRLLESI